MGVGRIDLRPAARLCAEGTLMRSDMALGLWAPLILLLSPYPLLQLELPQLVPGSRVHCPVVEEEKQLNKQGRS